MNSGTMQYFIIISMNEILRPIISVIITERVLYNGFNGGGGFMFLPQGMKTFSGEISEGSQSA